MADDRLPIIPIGNVRFRAPARVRGRVRSMRVAPFVDQPALEIVLVDDTGGLLLVFYGRRQIAGIELSAQLEATGVAGMHRGYLALVNPLYEHLPPEHGSH